MSKIRALTRLALPAVVVAAAVVGCGKQSSVDPELTAELIQPVARIELQKVTVAAGNRTGEEIYKGICAACHDAGLLDAPRIGEAGDWTDRIAMGQDDLTASAIAGKGAMPPRGGGGDLTDTEMTRVVAYMVNLSGGSFTEPPVE